MLANFFQGKHNWGNLNDAKGTKTCPMCLKPSEVAQLCMGAEPGTKHITSNLCIEFECDLLLQYHCCTYVKMVKKALLISFQILQVFMSIASLQTTVSCLAVTWLRRGRCDTGQRSPCPGEPRVSRRPAPSAQCHSRRVPRASSSSYLTTSTEVPRLEKCCSVLLKLLQPNIGDIFMT